MQNLSISRTHFVGSVYQQVSGIDESPESSNKEYQEKMVSQDHPFFTLWRQQFVDAVKVLYCIHFTLFVIKIGGSCLW